MGLQTYDVQVTSDTTVVTTAETIVATLPGVSTAGPNQTVRLQGELRITTGTNTTGLTLAIRRGSTVAGPVVGEATVVQVEAAAGSTEDHDIQVTDIPGDVASQPYVLTVTQAAASANGSVLNANLRAEVG